MSTTITQRALQFTADVVTEAQTQATQRVEHLAWSDDATVAHAVPNVVPNSRHSLLLRAATTSVLVGAISVIAAFGVVLFDHAEAPPTIAVLDGTHAAPSVPAVSTAAPSPNITTVTGLTRSKVSPDQGTLVSNRPSRSRSSARPSTSSTRSSTCRQ